jgi:hypothetical protein
MKETWDAKQLVPYIAGPYNQPKAGVENVRSMKYKVRVMQKNRSDKYIFLQRRIILNKIIWVER